MNTPAHMILNAAIMRASKREQFLLPIMIGALLPDAPMFLFYGYQKLIGTSESIIWNTLYFDPVWQSFFDIPNSVLFLLPCLGLTLVRKNYWWAFLFGSMLLHLPFDFLLHHDDGHRHFFPLSNFQFQSPVSYWDPRHYGLYASVAEIGMTLGLGISLFRTSKLHASRWILGSVLAFYGLFAGFVIVVWVN